MRISSRQRILLILVFFAAFLAVLLASNLVLYNRARSHLDNELGERLRAIAVTLALAVRDAPPAAPTGGGTEDPQLSVLRRARTENLLSNIVVFSPDGRTIVDLAEYSRPGEVNPFIELDYGAVALAQAGLSAYTALYRSGDAFMKSAYAPVLAENGEVSSIVGVEAGAGFFAELRELGGFILLVDAAATIAVLMLAFFFYRQTRSLDRAQAAVIRNENLATMGRMVAGIAHEIRNPLSIIKTSAERLSRVYNPKDETFSYISEEVDELDRILTGYLNFASAKQSDFADVSLKKVLRRCFMILDGEIGEKGIRLVQNLLDEDVVVRADDKRIQQAVLNILINSCQAVGRGGTITVTLDTADKSAVVRIRDDGAGIPEKDLKEVVKPFFTTKKQGSGLGLSIVDKIVGEHGGTLAIESAPGEGTVVSISLPRSGAA
jgi:signal transduction histidine kinase